MAWRRGVIDAEVGAVDYKDGCLGDRVCVRETQQFINFSRFKLKHFRLLV